MICLYILITIVECLGRDQLTTVCVDMVKGKDLHLKERNAILFIGIRPLF